MQKSDVKRYLRKQEIADLNKGVSWHETH